MRFADYVAVLANLDRQRREAKTPSQRRHIESARRHLTRIYESEKAKAEASMKG